MTVFISLSCSSTHVTEIWLQSVKWFTSCGFIFVFQVLLSIYKVVSTINVHFFFFFFSPPHLSLPSLRPLMDVNYLPLTDMRIARTFCFTNGGQALYLSSPTEIQRITYSQEMCDNLQVSTAACAVSVTCNNSHLIRHSCSYILF